MELKFEYAFATLSFAILGLSIQFSPSYGTVWPLWLISSWLLLLVASLMACYRIVYRTVSLNINFLLNRHLSQNGAQNTQLRVKFDALSRRLKIIFDISVFFFIAGIASNFVFVSVNYLCKTPISKTFYEICLK